MDIFGFIGISIVAVVVYAIIRTEIESLQSDKAKEKRGRENKDEFRIKILRDKTFKGWITIGDHLRIEGWWGDRNFIMQFFGITKGYLETIDYGEFLKIDICRDMYTSQHSRLLEIEYNREGKKQTLQIIPIVPEDGNLIKASIYKKIAENKRKAEIESLTRARYKSGNFNEISPTDFERVVQELFAYMGYSVTRVGGSGDGGIDLMCESLAFNEKMIVQCKRYAGKVGVGIVRDFYGAFIHSKVNKGFIVTTSDFTKEAQYWARGKPIELVNGEKLKDLMMTYYR